MAKVAEAEFWIIETKGREDIEVAMKDNAANLWCENATALTSTNWKYMKVNQQAFETLHPEDFAELWIALDRPESCV